MSGKNKQNEEKKEHNETKKSSHTFLKVFVVIFVVILLFFGWLGFVPGLSWLMGANRPKDLGIRVTEEDFQTASVKLGRTRETLPTTSSAEQSLKFSGSHNVDKSFSSEEVTATMQSRDYKYNPIGKDFQAKFSTDGTVEMSGTLQIGNFVGYGKASKVPQDQIDSVMSKVSFLKVNPSFYVKGEGKVVNNRLTYDVEKIEVGRFSLPVNLFPENKISNFVEDRINAVSGLRVDSLSIEDESLKFQGTYPDKSYYLTD